MSNYICDYCKHGKKSIKDEPCSSCGDVAGKFDGIDIYGNHDEKTIRDEFAMAALTGLMAGRPDAGCDDDGYAMDAYSLADAMLKAREGK